MTGRARTRIRQRLRELGELPTLDSGDRKPPPQREVLRTKNTVRHVDDSTREKLIRVQGMRGIEVQFAKCCGPMPGHAVIGYLTKRHTVTIHRADCSLLEKTERDGERMIAASWEGEEIIETAMYVTMGARPNVLADLTNAMRPMNIDITHAEYRPGDEGDSVFVFGFQTTDKSMITRVEKTLRMVSGVREVSTFPANERRVAG